MEGQIEYTLIIGVIIVFTSLAGSMGPPHLSPVPGADAVIVEKPQNGAGGVDSDDNTAIPKVLHSGRSFTTASSSMGSDTLFLLPWAPAYKDTSIYIIKGIYFKKERTQATEMKK